MNKVKSSYRFVGAFSILISICVLLLLVFLKYISSMKPCPADAIDCHLGQIRLLVFLSALELVFLLMFIKNCKRYVLSDSGVLVINPIFPFWRESIEWTELDYYIIVNEKSKYTSHDAIWIIRKRKLVMRISSAYYSNFDQLHDSLNLLNKGRKEFSEWNQLLMLLRAKNVG